MNMDQQVKRLWLEALRSGKYQKTTGRLKCNSGFCCLGVLCDIYGKLNNVEWDNYRMCGDSFLLPYEVREWAGLGNNCPTVSGYILTDHNDEKDKSFLEIADMIEKEL